ncbi:MAG TPA: hypothetical protein VJC18_07090 [bacterium]|nr:hypothetical protein [bacterium]
MNTLDQQEALTRVSSAHTSHSTYLDCWRGTISAQTFVDLSAPMVEDFHLYEMSENPNILMMDFRDSERQSRYLDRISYFVEIEPDDLMDELDFITLLDTKGVHCEEDEKDRVCGLGLGHDLKLTDVARFFNTIAQNGLELTLEENQLLDSLQMLGLLDVHTDGFAEATDNAVIISTFRDFSPLYRHDVMAHEIQHGHYFTNSAYRSDVNAVWDRLQPNVHKTLASILFYSGAHYNIDDDVLVRNEAASFSVETQTENNGWFGLFASAQLHIDSAMPHPDIIPPSEFKSLSVSDYATLFAQLHSVYTLIEDCHDVYR